MPRHFTHQPRRLLLLDFTLILAAAAHAQFAHEGPAKAIALSVSMPPYDVVSIKENRTGDGNFKMAVGDDGFTATNAPLLEIVKFAYDIKEDRISGLTGPVTSMHFDAEAKVLPPDSGAPRKLTDQQLLAMVIPLLADRFQMKAHLQLKPMPVYDLVVLRGGPKFHLIQAEKDDGAWGLNRSQNDVTLTAKGVSTANLADALSNEVHRNVIDRTGLKGATDITLKWTSDVASAQEEPSVSIFTAVQEQLGLKLQPSKGPVETLVIDHVDIPSKN